MLLSQYIATVADIFSEGMFWLIPFLGLLGVVAGERRPALLLFSFPFLVSDCYMVIAGHFHGRLSTTGTWVPDCMFAFVQIALTAYLVHRFRSAGFAAWALGFFSLGYGASACFFAGMAWTDSSL